MEEAGMQEVDTYVAHHYNTVAKFIATRTIMDLCIEAARRSGARISKRWWENEGLYLEGIWEAVRVVEV